jgi:hypothetical protein
VAVQRRKDHGGPIAFVVDAEADLATIVNPKVGQIALAIAEGTLHYHTGSAWAELGGGTGTGAPDDVDYLVGTADAGLSNEIVVGTSPGGELGGTWASPTVDASHSGSTHAATQAAAEATAAAANTADIATHAGLADPHTGYRLESADHSHASTGAQAGQLDHGSALTGLTDNDHTQYILHAIADAEGDLLLASAADTFTRLPVGGNGTLLTSNGTTASWQAAGAAAHPGFVTHTKFGND